MNSAVHNSNVNVWKHNSNRGADSLSPYATHPKAFQVFDNASKDKERDFFKAENGRKAFAITVLFYIKEHLINFIVVWLPVAFILFVVIASIFF